MPLLASLHPHILRFVCACLYPCILTSSYPHVHKVLACTLGSSYPLSSYPHVLTCVLASSHLHIVRLMCVCWYPRTLTSSYPQIYVSLGSHPQVNVFSIRMNECILTTSTSLVLGIFASHFVNNLQILRSG